MITACWQNMYMYIVWEINPMQGCINSSDIIHVQCVFACTGILQACTCLCVCKANKMSDAFLDYTRVNPTMYVALEESLSLQSSEQTVTAVSSRSSPVKQETVVVAAPPPRLQLKGFSAQVGQYFMYSTCTVYMYCIYNTCTVYTVHLLYTCTVGIVHVLYMQYMYRQGIMEEQRGL